MKNQSNARVSTRRIDAFKRHFNLFSKQPRHVDNGKGAAANNPTNKDTFALITEWAHDRNLIAGSDSFRQLAKLTEELGELAGGIAKQRPAVIADSIGDCAVVLTILAAQHGLTINDCIQQAYDEIKDRKGRMINGVFVKESDLPTTSQGGAL